MKRRGSLQRKLVVLVAASIAIATFVSTAIGLWQQSLSYVDSRRHALVTTAQIFAAAAAPATAARDQQGAFDALRGMARVPDIRYAEIRTTESRTLAGFGAVERLVGDVALSGDERVTFLQMLRTGTLEVSVPIVESGTRVGQFILIGGLPGLQTQLFATAAFTAAGGAVALLIGLLVAWRFQHRITRPLRSLLGAMARLGEEKRYDVAVEKATDREIGELVDGFNRMLGDIRERDEKLEAHARNLEDEVRARTVDLRVARDSAEAANRAKSDFLATMSHEIRTPMNGIMVMAELLVQANLPRRQQRFADVIAKSGKSLLAIINDILDFSKIEAGKLELERLPVDLNSLAENVTSLFAERAREKGLDLAAFVDPRLPPTVTSDPVRLGQIVSNLVNNALKFTEQGSVSLTIKALPEQQALRIAVTDSGIGIAKDKLGTIFESFSQADQTTTRNFGGTGLGLTISQRLAQALGGEIMVESELGHGSTFSLTFPIDDASGAPAWPSLKPAKAGGTCLIDVAGDATGSALAAYFAASGYAVTGRGANAGEPASAAIVCVDVEEVGNYRTATDASSTILIAVCAQGDSRSDGLLAAGKADACLTRPVLRSEVEALLARIVAGERVLQPATESARVAPVTRLRSFRVLVADDNAVNREVAFEALSQLNASVVTVEDGREAVDAVAASVFDIVFMDGSMPVMDGYEAARHIRAAEASGARRIPIVALTAHVVGAAAEEWRDAGMDAVVHKPFTVATLARTIENLLPHLAGETQPAAPDAPLAADPDSDTAALDAGILDQLRQLEANGKVGFVKRVLGLYAEHAPQAVQQIRDAAQAGDAAECARAAHALKSMSYNIGARPMAALAAEVEALGKLQAGVPGEAMLSDFERALARTLEAIGCQPEMAGSAAAQSQAEAPPAAETLEQALARAIERNELSVQYQPIVDRSGTTTAAVEALLRWQHDGKFVSPAEFIPLAEKSGSIHAIGAWVLRQACLDGRGWPGVTLSVNVSTVQFTAPDLAERIERIAEETGFPCERLELEITETALLTAEEAVFQVMRRLKAKGVSFALDDFGTGYSSLTYLRRFPFDKLKIDKSFIDDLALAVNATIVHAVTSIGRSIGLKLVAEGVENADQHRFLTAAGVHYLQGYFFGRPVPADAMTDRLLQEATAARTAARSA